MSINAIGDALKALANSLQVATLLPATLFVLANAYLVGLRDDANATVVTLLVLLILTLSYTLYALNFPLIRFLEGYKLPTDDIFRWLGAREQTNLVNRRKELARYKFFRRYYVEKVFDFDPDDEPTRPLGEYELKWRTINARCGQLERELDLYFPPDPILPTPLGNVMAAFEAYPRLRYGMDAIALWPRLVPILKERRYLDFVAQEKAVFDFLLNMLVVALGLGMEAFYWCLYQQNLWGALLSLGAAVFLCVLFYFGLLTAARQWGTTFRVAFDLYRHELHHRLGLQTMHSFENEYELWQEISSFLVYRRDEIWFKKFMSQAQFEKRGSPKANESSSA